MNKDNAHLYITHVYTLADGELEVQGLDGAWRPCPSPDFSFEPDKYRRKPKPREFLAVMEVDGSGILYRDAEQLKRSWNYGRPTIRVREVIE
jgi:hypothetical protein